MAHAAPHRLARTRSRGAAAVLWRFGRPHTLIGTATSILGIYLITAAEHPAIAPGEGLDDLFWVLVAGFAVNVAIVGVNQIEDVAIDRINKPFLPIAAGELSLPAARRIVLAASLLALALALSQGVAETLAVACALLIGWAYSVPPLRLKRFPLVAATSIAIVRALVVHLGVCLHFTGALAGERGLEAVPAPIWALTLFVVPFSLAIAVLKDVPDAEGDARHHIATFTVRLGGERVLRLGLGLLALAYLGMAIGGPIWLEGADPIVLVAGHGLALAALLAWSRDVETADQASVTRFYMRVWLMFFAEYGLIALACILG
jgi:homogentisate phytyltransferase/homogentisate geranylgeranyltransferase